MPPSSEPPAPPPPNAALPWPDLLRQHQAHRQSLHLLRQRRSVHRLDVTQVQIDGRVFIDFRANDYLGLSHHPAVVQAVVESTQRAGWGSGASPLLGGWPPEIQQAERAIAQWKQTESALLLPSGFQANVAAVGTFAAIARRANRPLRFLADKQIHASLIDAIAMTGLPLRLFPHNQFAKLRRLLTDQSADAIDVVVTESIFSMDGDAANLQELVRIKEQQPFQLLVDEAHGSGVYGEGGAGYVAEHGLSSAVDVTIVTLSKALGGIGGAVCGSTLFCDAVVNEGRSYIYSTGIPAAVGAAAMAALKVMRDEPQRQQRLRMAARWFRERLAAGGLALPAGDSPIVPVILGSEQAALDAAAELERRGMLVAAVRPPTVPRGSSRLRITLSSEHNRDELDLLGATIVDSCGKA